MLIFVRPDKTMIPLLHFNPPMLTWRGKWIHSQTHLIPLCFATFRPSARIQERKTWPPWDAPLEFRALEAAVILLRKSQNLNQQLPGYVGFIMQKQSAFARSSHHKRKGTSIFLLLLLVM